MHAIIAFAANEGQDIGSVVILFENRGIIVIILFMVEEGVVTFISAEVVAVGGNPDHRVIAFIIDHLKMVLNRQMVGSKITLVQVELATIRKDIVEAGIPLFDRGGDILQGDIGSE